MNLLIKQLSFNLSRQKLSERKLRTFYICKFWGKRWILWKKKPNKTEMMLVMLDHGGAEDVLTMVHIFLNKQPHKAFIWFNVLVLVLILVLVLVLVRVFVRVLVPVWVLVLVCVFTLVLVRVLVLTSLRTADAAWFYSNVLSCQFSHGWLDPSLFVDSENCRAAYGQSSQNCRPFKQTSVIMGRPGVTEAPPPATSTFDQQSLVKILQLYDRNSSFLRQHSVVSLYNKN